MKEYRSQSPEETRTRAREWARYLAPGTVIQLIGDLGAGKTTFVQGLAEGLACTLTPTSPTFSLLHEYPGRELTLQHWDLYRLGKDTDWSQLDLVDHLPGSGVTVVEWPERYPGPWPPGTFRVRITLTPEEHRLIHVEESLPQANPTPRLANG